MHRAFVARFGHGEAPLHEAASVLHRVLVQELPERLSPLVTSWSHAPAEAYLARQVDRFRRCDVLRLDLASPESAVLFDPGSNRAAARSGALEVARIVGPRGPARFHARAFHLGRAGRLAPASRYRTASGHELARCGGPSPTPARAFGRVEASELWLSADEDELFVRLRADSAELSIVHGPETVLPDDPVAWLLARLRLQSRRAWAWPCTWTPVHLPRVELQEIVLSPEMWFLSRRHWNEFRDRGLADSSRWLDPAAPDQDARAFSGGDRAAVDRLADRVRSGARVTLIEALCDREPRYVQVDRDRLDNVARSWSRAPVETTHGHAAGLLRVQGEQVRLEDWLAEAGARALGEPDVSLWWFLRSEERGATLRLVFECEACRLADLKRRVHQELAGIVAEWLPANRASGLYGGPELYAICERIFAVDAGIAVGAFRRDRRRSALKCAFQSLALLAQHKRERFLERMTRNLAPFASRGAPAPDAFERGWSPPAGAPWVRRAELLQGLAFHLRAHPGIPEEHLVARLVHMACNAVFPLPVFDGEYDVYAGLQRIHRGATR